MKRSAAILVALMLTGTALSAQSADELIGNACRSYSLRQFSQAAALYEKAFADGREFVGVGIKPRIAVSPTVADYRAGRDTVLERALEEIGKSRAKAPDGSPSNE